MNRRQHEGKFINGGLRMEILTAEEVEEIHLCTMELL